MTWGPEWGSPWSLTEDRMDHLTLVLEELLVQLRGKVSFELMVQFLAERLQACEEAIHDTRWFRYVDTAAGKNLDRLGVKLGQPRLHFDDNQYRAILKTRLATLFGSRTTDAILEVINVVIDGSGADYTHKPDPPAAVHVEIRNIDNATGGHWSSIIRTAKPEGVRMVVQITDDPDGILDLDDPTKGFDDPAIGFAHSFDK